MKHSLAEEGIVLLLAFVVLASVLLIALALASLFLLQSRLAGGAGDSVQAIYAADSGIEWRLYVERKATTSPPVLTFITPGITVTTTVIGITLQSVGSFRSTNRALEVRNFR